MKLIKLLMLFLVCAFAVSSVSGQANATIAVLTQNSGLVNQGGTVFVQVTVGNTGPVSPIGVNRVRAQISLPSAICTALPNAQQTGLPPGWIITVNTGGVITVCNGSNTIPVGGARTILIAVQGNNIGGPSTVTGNLLFSNGVSCNTPGTLAGDNSADNSSTSSIQVVPTNQCTLIPASVSLTGSASIACFGGTTILTANSGQPTNIEYSLNGGAFQTGNTFTVPAGTYTVVVRRISDPACTVTTNSVTVTQPASALSATASATNTTTVGGNDGTATANPAGGTPGYTYLWSPGGQTTQTATALTAGTYTVTVTDANGCTATASATVSDPVVTCNLAVTASAGTIACNGGTTTLTAIATGGIGAVEYSLNGGAFQSANTFTVNAAGSPYTVVAREVANPTCTATSNVVTVTQPAQLVATESHTAILCFGGSSTVTISATGGTTPYTGTGTFTQAAGTQSYTVTDANGCTSVVSVTVTEPTQLVASESHTAVLCFGGSSTVTISATGGTTPYTGTGTFTQAAGTQSYTVTDANGCTSVVSVTVTQPAAITASATSGIINCNGGTTTLTVIASGGTAPYQYSLNAGPPFQTSNLFTVGAGNFTVTVRDANLCTTTTSITISQPSALVATSTAPPITVVGGTTTVTVSATGGTAPYTGTGTFVRSAGTYNFTVTDANGCIATTSITLTNPLANASINVLTQNSGQVTQGGIVNVEVTVGNTGPTGAIGANRVRAQISLPGAIVSALPNAQQTGLPPGWTITANSGSVITVCNGSDVIPVNAARTILIRVQGNTIGGPSTVTGNLLFSNGTSCTLPGTLNGDQTADNSSTSSIEVISGCNIAVTASAGTIACFGGTTTLTATATGAAGAVEYSLNGGAFQSANTFTVTAAGSPYTVVAREVATPACTATSAVVTVTQPTQLVASSSATAILCNGGSSTVTVSATGGTSPYTGTGTFSRTAGTYSFTVTDANGCTAVTSVTIAEPTVLVASSSATAILCNGGSSTVTVSATGGTSPYTGTGTFSRTAGTYSFTVTDANGCTAVTSVTIAEPTVLVASSSATAILCNGGSSTVTVSATGGTAPYTGTGTFSRTAGTYSFTVTDANGCTAVTSVTIAEPAALTATATSTAVTTIGGSDGTATAIPVGGTTPYTYSWAPGGQTTATATGLTAGTYTVTVTDANGCIATATTTVGSPNCNITLSFTQTNVLCFGGVTGTATVTAANTTGTVSYSWNTVPVQTTATATGLAAGTYTVTVTDGAACTATGSVTITEPTQLVASSSATAILCNGGSSTVTVSATGGTAPYTGTGTFSRTAGTYSFTVTDVNGCTAVTSVTIGQPSAITASATSGVITCNGGTTTLTVIASGGTAPYQYSLNAGPPFQTSNLFTVGAGNFTVTVRDANLCTTTTSITISQPSALVATSTAPPITVVGGTTTVTVSATGGTAPYTGTGTFVRSAGTYNFTVTDANGCIATTSITLTNPLANASINVLTQNSGQVTQGGIVNVEVTVGNTGPTGAIGANRVRAQISLPGAIVSALPNAQQTGLPPGWTITANSGSVITVCNGSDVIPVNAARTILIRVQGNTIGGPSTVTGNLLFSNGTSCTLPGTLNGDQTADNSSTSSIEVISGCNIAVTASAGTIACFGGTTTLTATVTGAAGAVEYSLNGGAFQSANTFTVTAAGSPYTVVAREVNTPACTATAAAVTVTQPTQLVASSTAGTISCPGGTTTVIVSATGGTAPYTGTGTFTVSAGAYSYTVTDANGCTSVTSGTVAAGTDQTNPTITAPAALTVCTNSGCTATGVNLGTPLTADNCSVASVTNNAPASFPLGSTTVTWTVTDGSGNTATATQVVTVNDCVNPVIYFQGSSLIPGVTASSSSQSPYLLPTTPGGKFTSMISVNDLASGYRMVGIPDGLGAFDNNNGTFTLLMNHEIQATLGAVRAHGARGAFVSKWIINKSNLAVQSGSDLMRRVFIWNGTGFTQNPAFAFGRFCSADLPPVSAFYNHATGKGTQERIFMNGEETGVEGKGVGHVVTGTEAGDSYDLPYTGKFAWENSVASPFAQDKTIVVGLDDGQNGQVYVYVGTKTNSGIAIDKAGLNNGKLFGVKVTGLVDEVSGSIPAPNTPFTLFDHGFVQNTTGAVLDAASEANQVTTFLRPEDGAFDPSNPNDFYFLTTNAFTAPSRLWRLRFNNIATPETGGTITALLDGTEGQRMLDNLAIDKFGHVIMQEDVGNNDHNGKIWQYTIATDALTLVGKHDAARFGDLVGVTVTPPTAPFNRDEESSGIIDMSEILGPGMFLLDVQAHYAPATNTAEVVEGGQLLAFFNPASISAAPLNAAPDTIRSCTGTGVNLGTPATADNCSVASVTNNAPAVFPVGTTIVTWTVTDGSGNTATATQVVIISNLAVTATSTAVTTIGGSDGTATAVVTGGTAPYTYAWAPGGQTTATATGLTAGTYTVTVTDAAGCIRTATVTVGSPACNVTLSFTQTNVLCFGGATGTATVTAANTTGAVTYSWNTVPVQTTATATGLAAGTYTVTVTDGAACTASGSVTITQPTQLVASSSATAILCNSGSSTVTVSATGGTAPYTGTGTFSRTAGTYSFTVTDANGCTAVTTITIAQPAVLVATSTATAIACNGGSSTVTVSATGGTAPYTGTGTFSRTAGTYSFTVTDANGCTAVTTISIAQPAVLVATSTATAIACNGGSSTVTVSATGGTAPYTGTGTFSRTAGTYSFTVTDANGCTAVTTITIAQPAALVATSTATVIACNGGSSTVTVSATGGTAPYTGTGTFSRTAGTYSFTVTDANGCTAVTTITIAQPAVLVATSTATVIACNGGSSTVTVSATGGTAPYTGTGTFSRTAGTYSFTVTDSRGCTAVTTITITQPTQLVASSSATTILCNGGSSTVTVSATGGTAPYTGTGTFSRTAGTYSFTVTDANGCTATTSITITQPAAVAAPTVGAITQPTCTAQTGSVVLSGLPATGTWTLTRNPGAVTTTGTGTSTTISGLAAGTYTFTVTNAAGCTSAASANVVINTAPGAPSAPVVGAITQPTCALATGSVVLSGLPATGTWTLTRNPGGVTTTGTGTSTTISGLAAGTYTFTVTNAAGCTSAASANVVINAAPAAPSAPVVGAITQPACFGSTGSVVLNGLPATGTWTLTRNPGGVTTTGTGTSTTISGLAAGTYTFTVTSAGCTSAASANVVINASPAVLVATSTATVIACNGGSSTVTVSATGGTAPYTGTGTFSRTAGTYSFTVTDANGCTAVTTITIAQPAVLVATSTATAIACNGGSSTVTVSATGGTAPYTGTGTFSRTAGTYSFTVTDSKGCTAVTTITIQQPAVLVATSTATVIACNGGSSTVTVSATGGTAPYTGTGTFSRTAGTYSFTVTDAKGCTAVTTITIAQPAVLVATSTATAIACNGGSSTVTVSATGGTAPYTGTGTFSRTAGTYSFTVTDANGCTAVTTITIAQPAVLAVTTTSTPATIGSNGTATANPTGGTAPYTYLWTPGGQTTQTATGLAAGNYTVVVTDSKGCTATATVTVASNGCTLVVNAGPDKTLCSGASVTLAATVSGVSAGLPAATPFTEVSGSTTEQGLFSGNIDYITIGNTFSQSEDRNNCNKNATSSKTLTIPTGAAIKRAFLHWSGSGSLDNMVSLNGTSVTANTTKTATRSGGFSYFAGSKDVTSLVTGGGTYTVSNLNWSNGSPYCYDNSAYGGWALTVIYEKSTLPSARIHVNTEKFVFTFPAGTYSTTINNISVPTGCTADAKLTIVAFEGDNYKGEKFRINNVLDADTNNFRGQSGPNLDIITKNAPSVVGGTTSLTYSIESYHSNTVFGPAIEGLFDYVKVLKYNNCPAPGPCNVTYQWKRGTTIVGSTQSISVNTPGTYQVTATDCKGCIATDQVVVTTSTLAATSTAGTISCYGGTTTVTVSATGGTAPYTGTGTFTKGCGTWSFTVTDAAGCTAVTSVTLSQPTQLVVTATAPAIPCGSTTTTVTVAATGGTAPYTGTGTFVRAAGTYTFTVSDSKGCTASKTITITAASCGPVDPNKCYNIVNRNSGKKLSIAGCSTSNGANADQQTSSTCSTFKFALTETGFYQIINVNSGKVLDVSGASTADNANVAQYTYSGGNNQKWSLTASGTYFVIKAKHSGKAMSVKDASTSNGAKIVQKGTGSNTNEQWQIVEVGCATSFVETEGPVVSETVETIETESPVVSQTEEFNLSVYPNPGTTHFNLSIKSSDKTSPVNVRVTDVNGKVISLLPNVQVLKSNSLLRIGAEQLAAGVYFAEVTQGGKRKTVKMIKVN